MTTQPDHGHEHPQAAAQMREAATKYLNGLTPDQKAKTSFHYADGERIFWYYPPMNRHGLSLRDMDDNQRGLAYSLMATGLSEAANEQAKLIIEHEAVLGPLEKEQGRVTWDRNPLLYSWSVFGDPAGSDPWAWRVEGHHVHSTTAFGATKLSRSHRSFLAPTRRKFPRAPSKGSASCRPGRTWRWS